MNQQVKVINIANKMSMDEILECLKIALNAYQEDKSEFTYQAIIHMSMLTITKDLLKHRTSVNMVKNVDEFNTMFDEIYKTENN